MRDLSRLTEVLGFPGVWEDIEAIVEWLRDIELNKGITDPDQARDCALRVQGIESVREQLFSLKG